MAAESPPPVGIDRFWQQEHIEGRRRGLHLCPPLRLSYKGSIVTVIPATVTVMVIRKPAFIGFSFLLVMPLLVLADEGAFA